jgi:hypothetical protein
MVTLIVLRYNTSMKHADFMVDLVDMSGHTIGQKRRRDIDKLHDIYNGVFVLMVTPQGELVLGSITQRNDLPNIYDHKMGATVAAIRRSDEIAQQAAQRALARELMMDDVTVKALGEKMVYIDPGRHVFLSAYYTVAEPPTAFSTVDIEGLKTMNRDEFELALLVNPDRFAPTLVALWRSYHDQLPL